jgi:hypothetical protein
VRDICRARAGFQKSLGRVALATLCSLHPTELVFLTRHVVGQIHWGPGVTACQWTPLTAATQSMLPPWPAEQVLHALAGNTEPVIAHQATHAAGRLHVSR